MEIDNIFPVIAAFQPLFAIAGLVEADTFKKLAAGNVATGDTAIYLIESQCFKAIVQH